MDPDLIYIAVRGFLITAAIFAAFMALGHLAWCAIREDDPPFGFSVESVAAKFAAFFFGIVCAVIGSVIIGFQLLFLRVFQFTEIAHVVYFALCSCTVASLFYSAYRLFMRWGSRNIVALAVSAMLTFCMVWISSLRAFTGIIH